MEEAGGATTALGIVSGPFSKETLICRYRRLINPTRGVFHGENPLDYSLPLLLAQICLIIFLYRSLYFLLKPLRQGIISVQILAGIILGPSVLMYRLPLIDKLFPVGGTVTLQIVASLGLVLHLFVLSLQMDTSIIKKAGSDAVIMGITGVLLPLIIGGLTYKVIMNVTKLDHSFTDSFLPIVAVNSCTTFASITSLLADLRILNSDLGRLATRIVIVSDMSSFILTQLMLSGSLLAQHSKFLGVGSLLVTSTSALIVIYVLRPFIVWFTRYIRQGEPMKEIHFFVVVLIVLLVALWSEVLGYNFAVGPAMLGIVLPAEPQLGLELEQRLDAVCSWLILPVFFAISGLNMDISAMEEVKSGAATEIIIIATYVGKFTGTVVPALFSGMSLCDAFCLGLIMCCKGFIEVAIYCRLRDAKVLSPQSFNLLLISMLIITGVSRPIISYLYDPSKRYVGESRSILDSSYKSRLRILICVHNGDNVPLIINLLKACNPTRFSPITIFALHLIKLTGHASAILAPYDKLDKFRSDGYRSVHTVNAFNLFEKQYQGSFMVQHFIAVAPYKTMHSDICTVALDKRTNIIILPFHKQWSIDGKVGSIKPSIRTVNLNVMRRSPCSVGILIARGQFGGNQLSVLTSQLPYSIAVLFFGGPDDWEAVTFGGRLAQHPNVSFFVILFKHDSYDYEKVMNIEHLIEDLIRTDSRKQTRIEQVTVSDGEKTTQVIRSFEDAFDLVIVGKNHDPDSPVTSGITEWSECPELGVIGDMLSSSEFMFSVLVVAQPNLEGWKNSNSSKSLTQNMSSGKISYSDSSSRTDHSYRLEQ